jgi:enoyl-[acyl-carrier protein] reductase/trans-2-enoyl-CoA reductase (NAD+)
VGLVDVEVATDVDIERTNKFMGSSSLLWAEPLAEAGLLVRGESLVAFCDYDYPPDDPVYAMGPLAGAKQLQRKTMTRSPSASAPARRACATRPSRPPRSAPSPAAC